MSAPEPDRGRRRWLSIVLFVGTVAGIVIALRTASDSFGDVPWPGPASIGAALVLVTVAMLCSAGSWVVLFARDRDRSLLARGYVFGQVGKYVPGGVLQYARMYEHAGRAGAAPSETAVRMPIHALSAVLAPCGLASAALGLSAGHLAVWIRVVAVAGGVAGVGITTYRPLLAAVLDRLSARWSRLPAGDVIPSQREIIRAFALGVITSACFGGAYAVLLGGDGVRALLVAVCGFLVAFAVGYVAVPFPSGLGAREAALAALLFDVAPVAEILSTAVALRVVQITVDLGLAGCAALGSMVLRRRHGPTTAG